MRMHYLLNGRYHQPLMEMIFNRKLKCLPNLLPPHVMQHHPSRDNIGEQEDIATFEAFPEPVKQHPSRDNIGEQEDIATFEAFPEPVKQQG